MPDPSPTALKNVASTLHAVQSKYYHYFIQEQHVSGDVPSWAHFLFVYSWNACGRAMTECMKEMRSFFMH